jgi:starch-binding outer membrane protein SusE/F
MKYKLLLFASFLAGILFSCKKEENRVYFEGGTAPVLTASSTADLVLTDANKNNQAIRFSWTNPDYNFSTGVSSLDVTYTLQVDTTGANFKSKSMQEVAIAKDLSVAYTVKELNTILTKLEMAENIPHNIEFRIKATLGTNAAPLYSNVVKVKITPYLDVAVPLPPTGELYITGSALPSDWTNDPPAAQKLTKVNSTTWTYTATFSGSGKEYKFLSTPKNWQPQYGGSSATGGDLGFNMGLPGQSDPPGIPTPGDAGTYKITLNFKTGRYTVEKQ